MKLKEDMEIMDIKEIIKDSVNYPLSDWKKIIILGIIIVSSGITNVAMSLGTTSIDIIFFFNWNWVHNWLFSKWLYV